MPAAGQGLRFAQFRGCQPDRAGLQLPVGQGRRRVVEFDVRAQGRRDAFEVGRHDAEIVLHGPQIEQERGRVKLPPVQSHFVLVNGHARPSVTDYRHAHRAPPGPRAVQIRKVDVPELAQ